MTCSLAKGWSNMRFLSKLFKHWYLYLLPLIIFPVVATVYAKKTLSVYESTALLFFTTPPDGGVNYLTPAQNGANDMSQALESEHFCVTVAQGTYLATEYDLTSQAGQGAVTALLQSEISVTPTAVGQNLVTVTVDDKNPVIAQQIAKSFINGFGNYYTDNQKVFIQNQIALEQGQLQTAQGQLHQDQLRLQQYLQGHPACQND